MALVEMRGHPGLVMSDLIICKLIAAHPPPPPPPPPPPVFAWMVIV